MAIQMQKKKQETSMGRRLLPIAGQVIGGIYGGPAGAAAGGAIGGALAGGSGEDAVVQGLSSASQNGALGGKTGDAKVPDAPPQDSAMSRRAGALAQDPQVAIAEGLDVVSQFPPGHEIRKELIPPLMRAKMMGNRGDV